MQTHRVLVHRNGPTLWPEHKPLAEVLALKGTTPEPVWEATYQGNPSPPGGYVFKRDWWTGRGRYDHADTKSGYRVIGRWISWDTAEKDTETAAFTVGAVGELLADYSLQLRHIYRDRLEFPALPPQIESLARLYNQDGKLNGILIEDKSSGTSAYQTLKASAPEWLKSLLTAFQPSGNKTQRAQQAAVWCSNGMVALPHPGDSCIWLMDFEDELFNFPQAAFKDQVDAFSQMIIYLENFLAEGFRARQEAS